LFDVTIFKMGGKTKIQLGCQKKMGCATGILRHFVKGRQDWRCHPRQRKVGVELKRCCNMKRGPRGQRGWNMMGDLSWVEGWRTLMNEMRLRPSWFCQCNPESAGRGLRQS
jgi:hypothetical protein